MRKTQALLLTAVLATATSAAAQMRDDRYQATTGTVPAVVSRMQPGTVLVDVEAAGVNFVDAT